MPFPGATTFPSATTFPGVIIPAFVRPAVNPNWPLVGFDVDFTQGPPNTPGVNRRSINAAYRRLTVRSAIISRGRQYELDQVQAGTATLSVVDPLEYLNPDNSSGPFFPLIPYRCLRIWACWPNQPGSGNILTGFLGATRDVSFEGSTTGGWTAQGGTGILVSSAQHFDGTHALSMSQPGSGFAFGIYNQYPLFPGVQYTFSCHVFLSTTSTISARVTRGDGSTVTSSAVTTTGSWQPLSVTWTALDTMERILLSSDGGLTYIDAVQLEFGGTANTFTLTGPTIYNLFTGYVERYPTQYEMGGTRALRPLVAVDALAILSRTEISQSYQATIAADSPALFIPYSDTAPGNAVLRNVTSVTIATASTAIAIRGTQDVTADGTANWGGDTFLDGTPALTLGLQNASGYSGGTPVEYMSVDIPHTFGYAVNTVAATFEGWIKWTSGHFHGLLFGYNPGNTGTMYQQTWSDATLAFAGLVLTAQGIAFYANTHIPGGTTASATVPAGSSGAFSVTDASNYTGDGQWHYYAMVMRPNGSNDGWLLECQIDTHAFVATPSPTATGYATFQFNQIMNEALLTFGDKQSQISVANLAYYPTALTYAQRLAHYQRGIGNRGEKSGARVARLLTAYWAGATVIAPGQLVMESDFGYAPSPAQARMALDVIQEIQESERGMVYANRNGAVVFEDRATRATSTPQWVLGENPAGAFPAEYPYSEYAADYDPTYTFSQANLTRPGNANYPPQPQPLPVNPPYGQRVLTQQLQAVDDYSLAQAATFYLSRYAAPKTRISKITLNAAANPNLWPVVLGIEISQRNTATRRSGGIIVSSDYFTEKIDHRIDPISGTWSVDLQMSPVFIPSTTTWILGTSVLGSATTPIY